MRWITTQLPRGNPSPMCRHPRVTLALDEAQQQPVPGEPTLGRLFEESHVEGAHEVVAHVCRQVEDDLRGRPASPASEARAQRVQLLGQHIVMGAKGIQNLPDRLEGRTVARPRRRRHPRRRTPAG